MSVEQLVKNGFSAAFNKYIYDELVIGQLAHTELRNNLKKGSEIDIMMPGTVLVDNYDGGDLEEAEKVTTSLAKVTIDRGCSVHFGLEAVEEEFLKQAGEVKQAELIRNYTSDAIKQVAAKVDAAYGKLYTRAGHYVDDGGSAITLTADIAKDLLAFMQAKFKRGDGEGHTSWVDGQMIAVVPPEYQFYLGKLDELKYVESGHKQIKKGYVGTLCGWDIVVSNNVAQPEAGVFYPLFGIKGKTLAGGLSKDLNMMHYVPEKNFNTNYKGYALFGTGAPRADYLGSAKIAAPLSIK